MECCVRGQRRRLVRIRQGLRVATGTFTGAGDAGAVGVGPTLIGRQRLAVAVACERDTPWWARSAKGHDLVFGRLG
jgi:hypothetical protein